MDISMCAKKIVERKLSSEGGQEDGKQHEDYLYR